MDRRKSILNVSTSVVCKIILLAGSIILRRIFIKHLGLSLNGLNSLYVSVIGILSVAELGIGSAISFSMYEPIVNGDTERVASLYRLFKRAYLVIGTSMLLGGLAITPFLPYLVRDGGGVNANIYLSFVIFLVSVALGYTFNARLSLISAYKNNYISTLIQSGALLFQYALQCAAVLITKSFEWYLACGLVSSALLYLVSGISVKRLHKDILSVTPGRLESTERECVKSNVKAMLMHKIGGALVNSTDSVIISAFIGISVLGSYTNYAVIVNNVTAILTLAFTSLTSVVGHAFAKSRERAREYFLKFYSANFVIGSVFFLGFYATCDYLVKLLFDTDSQMGREFLFVMTLNYFIQFLRQAALTFRDGTGTFYRDRYKPAFEGGLNLVLSIALAILLRNLYENEYGAIGVLLATVITNLFICHTVEPYVLFKYAFSKSVKHHLLRNYAYIGSFTLALLLESKLLRTDLTGWVGIFINGGISVFASLILILTVLLFDKQLRNTFYFRSKK